MGLRSALKTEVCLVASFSAYNDHWITDLHRYLSPVQVMTFDQFFDTKPSGFAAQNQTVLFPLLVSTPLRKAVPILAL